MLLGVLNKLILSHKNRRFSPLSYKSDLARLTSSLPHSMLLSGVPLLEFSLEWDCPASCCRPRLEPSHGKLPSQTQQLQGTQAREAREAERIVLSVLESAPVPAGPQFSKSQFLTASIEHRVPHYQGLEKPAPAEASTSQPKLTLTFLPQPVWVFISVLCFLHWECFPAWCCQPGCFALAISVIPTVLLVHHLVLLIL